MTGIQVLLLVLLAAAVLVVLLWRWYRSRIFEQAGDLARQVFPVWAAQGPFDSGAQSAAAMRCAYVAVFGAEEAKRMKIAEVCAQHPAAYDSNPEAWEQTRQKATRSASPDTEKFVAIAKDLAATDPVLDEESKGLNEALQATTPSSIDSSLEWSSDPGAHEAHLMRRKDNPYFPQSRRDISQQELIAAKTLDEEDYVSCQQHFEELGKEIEALSSTVTSGDLLKLRERIDELIFLSMGVGGPAKEIASMADGLREAVISDLRAAFADDKETLSKIEEADTYHKDNTRRFSVPVMAQMLRANSPIPKDETIPTILSEDPSTIAIFINSLPDDTKPFIQAEALRLMQQVLRDGYADPNCEEKILALEGKWPMQWELPAVGGV